MSWLQRRVRWFHRLMGQADPVTPTDLSREARQLRARLVAEEAAELVVALVGHEQARQEFRHFTDLVAMKRGSAPGELPEIVDGCADLMVVATGTLAAAGVNDTFPLMLVCDANDAKMGGGKDAAGKFAKPPGWSPPDIEGELRKQGWAGE